MSSIKLNKAMSGEEVRNMTVQWDYSEQTSSDSDALSAVLKVLNKMIHFISMVAGVATTLAILAWLTGFLTFAA